MSEHLSATPDKLSPQPLSMVELGSIAVEALAEQSETPRIDVEQQESERKKNTMENLRALQNRFGERFVKGNLMEGGGYTGGAARELLARFMDQPGFSNELKRLIPNKRGALLLLKENQSYIQAALEQIYKDDLAHEAEPVQDPYELARSANYELTGPFESTAEFVHYNKRDFRPDERLCTFNNPVQRLEDYNIFWLRHAEVAETLPADQLTADNLSSAWKVYLKTIGRYDRESDTYNLADLVPARDDPYGISSMSVQISRQGAHVSIKNRYNHTVGNPDNTLDSNLDNVVYGLKRAVYSSVDREDLMDRAGVYLADQYITDNDGGIHPYWFEENNTYYGSYEYIENGVVTTIDRGKYLMISPQLYAPINQKGDELSLRPTTVVSTEITTSVDQHLLNTVVELEYGTLDDVSEEGVGMLDAFYENDARAIELRREYAARDRAELKHVMPEVLMRQARTSYEVYLTLSARLHEAKVVTEDEFAQLIDRKMAQWQENGTIDYLVDGLYNLSQPSIVATPNVLADANQIQELIASLESSEGLYNYSKTNNHFAEQYSKEELSGNLVDDPLRLSIVLTPMIDGTVEELREQLSGMQADDPELNFRVPSVLEAVSYWSVIRKRGILTHQRAIRHFDLPEYALDPVGPCVLTVGADASGQLYLNASEVDSWTFARLAVG